MLRYLVTLAIVLAPLHADAKMMNHYDLASLIVQGDAVVIADRVGATKVAPGATPRTRYRVVRSLRGTLAPGQTISASSIKSFVGP